MIFRISLKLNANIKAGTLATLPLHANPLADWSARSFVAGRTQHIILSNTKSLYSAIMCGKAIANERQFVEHSLKAIREVFEGDGEELVYRNFIAPGSASVCFSKALDRSVTGSMNDLIRHATAWLAEGVPPNDVSKRLYDILLSALAQSNSDVYGKPRDALKTLVSGVESASCGITKC
jgi:Domain of unknown function (DUF6933)